MYSLSLPASKVSSTINFTGFKECILSIRFFLTGMDDDSLCYSVLLKYQACKSCITFTLLSLCKQLFGNNTYTL